MACEDDVDLQITISQKRVRLQIYDDGIGEYVYDKPISSITACGHEVAVGVNRVKGPFLLCSPISISKRGLGVVSFTNIESVEGSVRAHFVLVFAVPKKDRWNDIKS